MIVIRKIVKIAELETYFRDLKYSKIEVKPASLKKLKDIAILCYYRVEPRDVLTIMGLLKQASKRKDLPLEVKNQIYGFCVNFSNNNLWMSLTDFKEMLDVEEKHSLNFGIHSRYKTLFKELYTIEAARKFIKDV